MFHFVKFIFDLCLTSPQTHDLRIFSDNNVILKYVNHHVLPKYINVDAVQQTVRELWTILRLVLKRVFDRCDLDLERNESVSLLWHGLIVVHDMSKYERYSFFRS